MFCTVGQQAAAEGKAARVKALEVEIGVGMISPTNKIDFDKNKVGYNILAELRYNFKSYPFDIGLRLDGNTFNRELKVNEDMLKFRSLCAMAVFDCNINRKGIISPFLGVGIGGGVVSNEAMKIKDVTNDEKYNDIIDELIDRFGDFPDDVKYLIDLTFLKNITEPYIEKTKSTKNTIEFILKEEITQDIDGQKLFEAVHKIGSMIRLSYKDNRINIIFDLPVVKRVQWFEYALDLFKDFERFKKDVKKV